MATAVAAGDTPPERKASHKAGGSKQQRIYETLVGYYGFAGLAVSRWDQTDGAIIAGSAEACADAWMQAGKGEPKIMRVLELITIASPYTALVMVHMSLAFAIMNRHDANPFAGLFAPVPPKPATAPARTAAPVSRESEARTEPAPLPYTPVGANAPTEAAGPPVYQGDEGLRVIPDEGLSADDEIMLREAARQSGRPYQELRQEVLLEIAQMRMRQQNGHRVQTPGALGAPVARE